MRMEPLVLLLAIGAQVVTGDPPVAMAAPVSALRLENGEAGEIDRLFEKVRIRAARDRGRAIRLRRFVYNKVFGTEQHSNCLLVHGTPGEWLFTATPAPDSMANVSRRRMPDGSPFRMEAARHETWLVQRTRVVWVDHLERTFEVFEDAEDPEKSLLGWISRTMVPTFESILLLGPFHAADDAPETHLPRLWNAWREGFNWSIVSADDRLVKVTAVPLKSWPVAQYSRLSLIIERKTGVIVGLQVIDPAVLFETVYVPWHGISDEQEVREAVLAATGLPCAKPGRWPPVLVEELTQAGYREWEVPPVRIDETPAADALMPDNVRRRSWIRRQFGIIGH